MEQIIQTIYGKNSMHADLVQKDDGSKIWSTYDNIMDSEYDQPFQLDLPFASVLKLRIDTPIIDYISQDYDEPIIVNFNISDLFTLTQQVIRQASQESSRYHRSSATNLNDLLYLAEIIYNKLDPLTLSTIKDDMVRNLINHPTSYTALLA